MMQPMTPGASTAANIYRHSTENTRLRAEVKRLRDALTAMMDAHPFALDGSDSAMTAAWFINAAKTALEGDSE